MGGKINEFLVRELLLEQFPQWAPLPLKPVPVNSIDNRSFRLGTDKVVRLPSAEKYAAQVQKEQVWLPKLAPHLSVSIPEPLAQGRPTEKFPRTWSIYRWIEGESANTLSLSKDQLEALAADLSAFLKEFHKVDPSKGPEPGAHNFFRGAPPSVYDEEARASISSLRDRIDADQALAVWERAIDSYWNKGPVWIHGDFASGNILLKENRLIAVIDFGCMGIGDPACDLVITWTFLKGKARKIFKDRLSMDGDTWARARGWALWKACLELKKHKDPSSSEAKEHRSLLNDILLDSSDAFFP